MENNFIHECSSNKDDLKISSIENKSESNSFEIKSGNIGNAYENYKSSSLVSQVYTHTPSKKSQKNDFVDWQNQNNIGFHEIKEKVDEKKKTNLLNFHPNDFKNVNFPVTDKFVQLFNKFIESQNETNEIQRENNEIQRETNKKISKFIENQDKYNKGIYELLTKK